jgi:hypothetical protein
MSIKQRSKEQSSPHRLGFLDADREALVFTGDLGGALR